ncbi:MAG: nitrilase-related carbon-nitrogen hydrolase [Acholeplasmataceae bacterium]|jgi:predicted amidohydrolase
MKIGLVSAYSHNKIEENINTIIKFLSDYQHLDFLLFSEAFLQGFNSLTWNYFEDITITINRNDSILNQIKKACKKYNTAVGFGYYETDNYDLYCSYMIINNNGELVNNYRRLSTGWKVTSKTNHYYKEGTEIIPFTLNNYNFITLICGDLWDDNIKEKAMEIINKEKIDTILWPNHLDYTIAQFNLEIQDYQERSKDIKVPLLLINDHSETSCGGAVVFKNNNILHYLKIGTIGVLEFDLTS